jgi:hypothetical protein
MYGAVVHNLNMNGADMHGAEMQTVNMNGADMHGAEKCTMVLIREVLIYKVL